MPHYSSTQSKTIKLVPGGKAERREALRAAGVAPAASMGADVYKCIVSAATQQLLWGGKPTAVVEFRVCEGDHFGVALTGYARMKLVQNQLMPDCQYYAWCRTALGREPEAEDLLNPDSVFPGKVFDCQVEYRSRGRSKNSQPEDPRVKKDEKDFLRVTRLLRLGEL